MIEFITSNNTSWSVVENFTHEIPDVANLTASALNALTRYSWPVVINTIGFTVTMLIGATFGLNALRTAQQMASQTTSNLNVRRLLDFLNNNSARRSPDLTPIFDQLGELAGEMSAVEVGRSLSVLAPYVEQQAAHQTIERVMSRIPAVASDMDTHSLASALTEMSMSQLRNPTSHEAARVLITRIPRVIEDMPLYQVYSNLVAAVSYRDGVELETIRPAVEALAKRLQAFVEEIAPVELPLFFRALVESQVRCNVITETFEALAGHTLQNINSMNRTQIQDTRDAFLSFEGQHPSITAAIQALETGSYSNSADCA